MSSIHQPNGITPRDDDEPPWVHPEFGNLLVDGGTWPTAFDLTEYLRTVERYFIEPDISEFEDCTSETQLIVDSIDFLLSCIKRNYVANLYENIRDLLEACLRVRSFDAAYEAINSKSAIQPIKIGEAWYLTGHDGIRLMAGECSWMTGIWYQQEFNYLNQRYASDEVGLKVAIRDGVARRINGFFEGFDPHYFEVLLEIEKQRAGEIPLPIARPMSNETNVLDDGKEELQGWIGGGPQDYPPTDYVYGHEGKLKDLSRLAFPSSKDKNCTALKNACRDGTYWIQKISGQKYRLFCRNESLKRSIDRRIN